jgi:exo-1,4-beta-D-glucosaminidase
MKPYFTVLFLFGFVFLSNCQKESKTDFCIPMKEGWRIQSSEKVGTGGRELSSVSYVEAGWYAATVPTTVLNTLVKTGEYKDIFVGRNFELIPKNRFTCSWWYRKVFDLPDLLKTDHYRILFEGLNYKANIWLNGKLAASSDSVESPFRRFEFDITSLLQSGKNALAVEVIPPKKGDLTIGFVDWNPTPPDHNMGLWRGVSLLKSGTVSLQYPFVKTSLVPSLKEATLEVSVIAENYSDMVAETDIKGSIGNISFHKKVSLQPKQKQLVVFNANEFKELQIENPKIWWPAELGEPNLYSLNLEATIGNILSDKKQTRFGIREIKDFINQNGHRGYMINGRKILIRGAGWVDDILLADSDEKVKAQVEYVKQMNLNTIRFEGFWGRNDKIYDYADELGLLVMVGWSCQWEWEGYCGRPEDDFLAIRTPEEMKLHTRAYMDQVHWLRNHPSLFLWVFGSDKIPRPELETQLREAMKTEDPTRPLLNGCKGMGSTGGESNISKISGPTGVKMLGPYDYVTPNYWYLNKNAGGAYGFNTETGPGPQVPPINSIRKMIPKDSLWPMNKLWDYHCGRNEFSTLKRFLKAFNARYGESTSAEDFATMCQVSNYEAIRPMYEAFAVNKYNATGVIQWMLNSAWPEFFWQQYDWYLMPNGAFYGTRKACNPVNIVYNYGDKAIYLTNELSNGFEGLTATITIVDIDSKVVLQKEMIEKIDANSSGLLFKIPELKNISTTYFVDLKLKDKDKKVIADNFYWLSTKDDILDEKKSSWFVTPNSSYADLQQIRQLAKADVKADYKFKTEGAKRILSVKLTNTGKTLAFFIEMNVLKDKSKDNVLPVLWNDNYVSLLPGETKEYTASFNDSDLGGEQPIFQFSGINVKQ